MLNLELNQQSPKPDLTLRKISILAHTLSLLTRVLVFLHFTILLHDLALPHLQGSHRHERCVKGLAKVHLLRRHKDVEPAGHDEAAGDEEHDAVDRGKGKDVQGVVALLGKGWVGKRHNDGENRGRDVAKDDRPEPRNAPVLAGGDDNVEVTAELVARVECQPPEPGQHGVVSPESRRSSVRSLGHEDRDDIGYNKDTKAHTCTSFRSYSLADSNSKDHGHDVTSTVQCVSHHANLSDHVRVAVERRGAHSLTPHDKDEAEVVGPGIDGIQQVEAKLGAVNK